MKRIKIIANVLLVILIIGCTTVKAEQGIKITSLDNVSVKVGEYIEIPIGLEKSINLMGVGINISFDKNYLVPMSVKKENILTKGIMENSIGTKYENPIKILWFNTEQTNLLGKLFSIKFYAKKSGNTIIKIKNRTQDTFNDTYNDVRLLETSVHINIEDKKQVRSIIKQPKIKKIKLYKKKKNLGITVAKLKNNCDGYQIEYSINKKFKKSKTILSKRKTRNKFYINKIKKGKIYYIRVRAFVYEKENGKRQRKYSKWSNVRKKRIRK